MAASPRTFSHHHHGGWTLLWVLFFTATITLVSTVAAQEPTCECKAIDRGESFIVTRLWNIIHKDWTDQMVIDEFGNNFAPVVTHLPGFQEYASATTGNDDTVFFMNIFESQEDAKAAQEAAKTFVQKGVLNGVITPKHFTENVIDFHVASEECITDAFDGKFLATQIWTIAPDVSTGDNSTTLTIADIAQEFEQGYAPVVQDMDGFLEYGGALVSGTDLVFFFAIFDNFQSAADFNTGAETFVEENAALGNGMIEKVEFTEGTVGFDYTCAAGNSPPPKSSTESSEEEPGAAVSSASTISTMVTMAVCVMVGILMV